MSVHASARLYVGELIQRSPNTFTPCFWRRYKNKFMFVTNPHILYKVRHGIKHRCKT